MTDAAKSALLQFFLDTLASNASRPDASDSDRERVEFVRLYAAFKNCTDGIMDEMALLNDFFSFLCNMKHHLCEERATMLGYLCLMAEHVPPLLAAKDVDEMHDHLRVLEKALLHEDSYPALVCFIQSVHALKTSVFLGSPTGSTMLKQLQARANQMVLIRADYKSKKSAAEATASSSSSPSETPGEPVAADTDVNKAPMPGEAIVDEEIW